MHVTLSSFARYRHTPKCKGATKLYTGIASARGHRDPPSYYAPSGLAGYSGGRSPRSKLSPMDCSAHLREPRSLRAKQRQHLHLFAALREIGGRPAMAVESIERRASIKEIRSTPCVPTHGSPMQRRPVAIGVACIDVVPLGEPSLRSAAGRQEESTRATKELAARDP